MPRAKPNSPRPACSVGDRYSLYWSLTAQFVFRMTSERNDAGNTQSHSRGPTSSRNSSLTSENWPSKICNSSGKRRVGNVLLGFLSPGRATTDLKPRSTACCPNSGSTNPVRISGGRRNPGLRPNGQTNAQRVTRAASAARWSRPSLEDHQPLRDTMLAPAYATHITQHNKKKAIEGGIRNKPGINQL